MKNETVKTGMRMGAVVGGLVFAVAGIMPGFYFGSFGTLILLQKLMGSVEPGLMVRAAIVIGSMVGIASAAAVSLVVGGLLGTAVGYVVSIPAAYEKQAPEKA